MQQNIYLMVLFFLSTAPVYSGFVNGLLVPGIVTLAGRPEEIERANISVLTAAFNLAILAIIVVSYLTAALGNNPVVAYDAVGLLATAVVIWWLVYIPKIAQAAYR